MVTVGEVKLSAASSRIAAWLPLVVLPAAAVLLASGWPAWIFMWTLAFSIYAGLKWLSLASETAPSNWTTGRALAYLLLWPGMDAASFLTRGRPVEPPSSGEWLLAGAKLAFGGLLIAAGVSLVDRQPVAAGWIGMAGVVFTLHFGVFHLLSLLWRRAGVDAAPIMEAPGMASSLGDFWGRRWNLAFRDLAHTFVFRPVVTRRGIAAATMAVFLVSGLVHDAVISIPARGGYGLPTLYFLIQGCGVLLERSRIGRRMSLRKSPRGRLLCGAVVLAPVGLAFHRPFVERVVVPMLQALGSL